MNKNKNLYSFYWDCGRQGSIRSKFVATEDEIKKNIGKQIYYGEALGKHSEIVGTLEESDLKILTDDQDFIEKFEKYIGKSTGHNPLEYIEEEEENE